MAQLGFHLGDLLCGPGSDLVEIHWDVLEIGYDPTVACGRNYPRHSTEQAEFDYEEKLSNLRFLIWC